MLWRQYLKAAAFSLEFIYPNEFYQLTDFKCAKRDFMLKWLGNVKPGEGINHFGFAMQLTICHQKEFNQKIFSTSGKNSNAHMHYALTYFVDKIPGRLMKLQKNNNRNPICIVSDHCRVNNCSSMFFYALVVSIVTSSFDFHSVNNVDRNKSQITLFDSVKSLCSTQK